MSISSGVIGCGKGLKLEVQGRSIGKQPSSSKHLVSFLKPKKYIWFLFVNLQTFNNNHYY